MITIRRAAGVFSALTVLACMLACSSGGPREYFDLRKLAPSYLEFHKANGRGPAGPDEWLKFEKDAHTKSLIEQTRPGGTFVFYWKVKIPQDCPKGTKTLLGYERKVSVWREKRCIALCDGSTTVMTPAEFQSAPRPQQKKQKK